MDYIVDIIILKREIELVNLHERMVEWGNERYHCEPPCYVTDSGIVFEQIENIQYDQGITGKAFTEEYAALNLKSDMLSGLEYEVNCNASALEENALLNFLTALGRLSVFYLMLVREDEEIKERHEVITGEETCARVLESLQWSLPKDVLIFKEKPGLE